MYVLGPRDMEIAASTAADKAPLVFQKWTQDVAHYGTWKAICTRNGGAYKTKGKDGKTHHWNDDLAEELTKRLDRSLRTLVNPVLPGLRDSYIAKMEEHTAKFPIALKETSMGVTMFIANPLQNLSYNLDRLRAEKLRVIASRFEEIISQNREVHRKVPPMIEMHMKPGYSVAERQKGN
jgi:hypothetical protein